MALSLASISKKAQVRSPRIILTGVEKIGKTSFACGARFDSGRRVQVGINDPIVLPIKGEEGADDMPVPKFPTLHTYDEVLEALGVLYTEDVPYKTVVIDSVSALEPLIWDHTSALHGVEGIEQVGGGYGKGYTEALAQWRELQEGLDALRSKGIASVLIGHVKVKRFDDPNGDGYDRYQFDVNEKAANLLSRWADVTLFATTKVVVKKEDRGFGQEKKRGIDVTGGSRFLLTQPRPAHPGGGRGVYGQLPYELPLDWSAFAAAVADVMDNEESE